MLPPSIPIPILERPSAAAFERDVLGAGRPAIVRGAIAHWPALGRWSPAYLKERFGRERVSAFCLTDGLVRFDKKRGLQVRDMTVDEFVTQLDGDAPDKFRLRSRLPEAMPGLRDDFDVPPYCRGRLYPRLDLWVSAAGSITQLHFDVSHNLQAHVTGEKRWLLFPPEQSRLLYRFPLASSTPELSRVDLSQPDFARFPLLAETTPWEARALPGDLLFVPSRWWHYVESRGSTMSVSFWWVTPLTLPFVAAADVYKKLRGLAR